MGMAVNALWQLNNCIQIVSVDSRMGTPVPCFMVLFTSWFMKRLAWGVNIKRTAFFIASHSMCCDWL